MFWDLIFKKMPSALASLACLKCVYRFCCTLWLTLYYMLVCRFVGCSWRGNGEVVLPKMSGRLPSKVIKTSPHGRRILWHWVSTHAVHGSPGVQTKTSCKPVHCTVGVAFQKCSWWYRTILKYLGKKGKEFIFWKRCLLTVLEMPHWKLYRPL